MDVTKEVLYSSDQIHIPPQFLFVLKKFAKAAIKTQPYDLLLWSCHYFQALADEREPPVKLRLEHPIYNTNGGLSRGYLRILINQLGVNEDVDTEILKTRWLGSCLKVSELDVILCMSGALLSPQVPMLKFAAVCAGMLTKNLKETMNLLCEVLTSEPEGGSAMIALDVFLQMYTFLAKIDASADVDYIDGVIEGDISLQPEITKMEEPVCKDNVDVCECSSEASCHIGLGSTDSLSSVRVTRLPMLGVSVAVGGGSTSKRLKSTDSLELKRPPPLDQLIRKSTLTYERERQVRNPSDPRELLLKMEQDKKETEAALAAEAALLAGESERTSGEELEEEEVEMVKIKVFNEEGEEIPPNIDKSQVFEHGTIIENKDVTNNERKDVTDTAKEDVAITEKKDVTIIEKEDNTITEKEDATITEKEDVTITEKVDVTINGKEDVTVIKKEDASIIEGEDVGGDFTTVDEGFISAEYLSQQPTQTLESVQECKENRIKFIEKAFEEIAEINHLVKMQAFDLGALTGRQMSVTSAEFVVPFIENEIIQLVYEQTDNFMEKPKEKMVDPRIVEDIGTILNDYLTEALETIIPEPKIVEEKEHVVVRVYAVPGIGPVVPEPVIAEFVKYAQEMGSEQGLFMPRYLRHIRCPPLELPMIDTDCYCPN